MKKYLFILSTVMLLAASCNSQPTGQYTIRNDNQVGTQQTEKQESQDKNGQGLPQGEKEGWKTYSNSEYGFEFKYPPTWQRDGWYFSPQKIEVYESGSILAPVRLEVINASGLNEGNIAYQIKNSKRKSQDTIININGIEFSRYDLEDYGRYEGDSAGRVLIYRSSGLNSPKGRIHIIFEWQEKPSGSEVKGNNAAIFEQVLSTFKFTELSSTTDASEKGLVYINSVLGFQISLPENWKGYKVRSVPMSSNFGAGSFAFQVPTQDKNFTDSLEYKGYATPMYIHVYNKQYWDKVMNEEGPKPGYLGENSEFVFAASFWQDPPGDWINKGFNSQELISAFKVIK